MTSAADSQAGMLKYIAIAVSAFIGLMCAIGVRDFVEVQNRSIALDAVVTQTPTMPVRKQTTIEDAHGRTRTEWTTIYLQYHVVAWPEANGEMREMALTQTHWLNFSFEQGSTIPVLVERDLLHPEKYIAVHWNNPLAFLEKQVFGVAIALGVWALYFILRGLERFLARPK